MLPCCDLCSEKYLDSKSQVDEKALKKTLEKKEMERPAKLCKCSCHIKGFKVLH